MLSERAIYGGLTSSNYLVWVFADATYRIVEFFL